MNHEKNPYCFRWKHHFKGLNTIWLLNSSSQKFSHHNRNKVNAIHSHLHFEGFVKNANDISQDIDL